MLPAVDSAGLRDLVEHSEWVDANQSVEAVYEFFQGHGHEYVAVVADRMVIGVSGRSHVRALLAGRYGFALFSRTDIRNHLVPGCLRIPIDTALTGVLSEALSRSGDSFYDDVVLVDTDGSLVGLISTRRLVEAQSAIVREQLAMLDAQHAELTVSNQRLTDSLAQQRLLERQIIEREKAALIETLAGGVAHELNNKLMPVVGYVELLIEELKPTGSAQLQEYCQLIHESAFAGARIIRQLLELSRPMKGEHIRCDLRRIVEQSLTLVELRLREAGVGLTLELQEGETPVHGDPDQLKQVLVNLLLNALDAIAAVPAPGIAVRLGADAVAAQISVSDNGCGIPADAMPRIFDPFFTTKAPDVGTGLGLSVCLSIVKQHQGALTAESKSGAGTTFCLTLPLADASAGERPAPAPALRTSNEWVGRRVLVIDDQRPVGRFVAHALHSKLGCEVDQVDNGEAAQAVLQDATYDLIFSDIRMPQMNGVEFLEWVGRHRPELAARVIMMTGDASDSALNHEIQRMRRPLLRKPFKLEELLQVAVTALAGPR